MSLILDALRRADSERERGEVPGLYAQPVPAVAADAPSPPRVAPWLWAALVGTGVLIVGAFAYWLSRDAPVPAATAVTSPPAAGQVATAMSPDVPAPAPQARPAEVQEVAEPAKWPAADRRKAADSPPSASVPAPAEKPLAAAKAQGSATPVEPPVLSREQMPDDIRAGLPALNVGGSIYSTDAASRSVIINGRVLRENDRLNAEIVVEQIRLKSAVLRYRGHRFEIQF